MISKIQKWGNSLAVRIPKPFAEEIGVDVDMEVDLVLEDGKLILSKPSRSSLKLDELLGQMTEENLHDEVDFGSAVGREAW